VKYEAMDDVTEPPMTDLAPPDAEHLGYDEVLAAVDALSALDQARLDRLELRHLEGTDYAEGDLLHAAVCSAILGKKKCPRTTRFIAFLAQSMRNIAGRQRKKLRRQVPLSDGSAQDDGDEEFELEDDKPDAEQAVIQVQNDRRAAEVWTVLEPHYRVDEQIQLLLLGMEENMRGKELREFVGVTQDQLDYIVKRIRRISAKHFSKGWPL
jgi:DNA-directed RNA polymerase specialized sigma24 family protein